MADEVGVMQAMRFAPSNCEAHYFSDEQSYDASGTPFIRSNQTIGTTVEALALGDVTSLGWAWFHNKDTTNYIKIRNGSGGADLIRVLPGMKQMVYLEPTCVPYAIANSAACVLDYFISSA